MTSFRPARALPKVKGTHVVHAIEAGSDLSPSLYALCGARAVIWAQGATFADLLPTCSACKAELRKSVPLVLLTPDV